MKNLLLSLFTTLLLNMGANAQTIATIVANSPDHNILEQALNAAALTAVLDGTDEYTLFAPTDNAFANLPAGLVEALLTDPQSVLSDVLLYHVVEGTALSSDLSNDQVIETFLGQNITITLEDGMVMVNNALVTIADIEADNGLVHVIDAVLIPITTTIYDFVADSPDHTTLESALNQAELDGTLSGPGAFTLFAPTDDAFDNIDPATLSALLSDPEGSLTDVLLYHVIESIQLSTNLSDGPLPTLFNENVTVSLDGATVMINNAMVTISDEVTINGIVHVIDSVLIPTVLSVQDIKALNSLSIFPNPAIDTFTILMDVAQSERVAIDIMDVTGKIVLTKNLGILSLGRNLQTLDVRSLESGIYLITITIGKEQATTKLQVGK